MLRHERGAEGRPSRSRTAPGNQSANPSRIVGKCSVTWWSLEALQITLTVAIQDGCDLVRLVAWL